ncbi:MAG: alpha/beta hydrolase [Rhodospirillaceae bacterium]|nr:alpha/beta hydrolase [Rhodospirillaceae bacterium]
MPEKNVAEPKILTRETGSSIAYHMLAGKSPGIVFMTGFMSDMTGSKALALEELCRDRGHAFLRFDYRGHGASSGNFANGTIGLWAEDALAAVDSLTEGPQVIVGSSMGGWIMLLTALARPHRIAGLLGVAAAPDFTEDLLAQSLTEEQLQTIGSNGSITIPSEYGDPYTITKALLDDGTNHVVMRTEIALDCPVRLLHGLEDSSVPWQRSLTLQERLRSDDVDVTLIKGGDHRLSRDQDLKKLQKTAASLLST